MNLLWILWRRKGKTHEEILALLTLLAIFLLSGVALGDTLYLRDGRSFRGTLIGYINGRFASKLLTQLELQLRGIL